MPFQFSPVTELKSVSSAAGSVRKLACSVDVLAVKRHVGEKRDAEHGVDEEQDEEQRDDVGEGRQRRDEGDNQCA